MHVRNLPLSDAVRAHYEDCGIGELYPPQTAAVEAGVCEGERVVAAVPTASGKTFVAELAMLTADGPALYICPLRALAREKYDTFSELPGVSVGIATGDFDASSAELAEHDIVVATSEKVDSAIRNGAPWVDHLACIVVDEVHLLGAEGRGPTLEVTLATLQRRTTDAQVVALSATVANPGEIADWLGADLVESEWRPVDLRRGVYADGRVAYDDGADLRVAVDAPEAAPSGEDADTEATAALVADAVRPGDGSEGGQCLAFVRSRREAESLAERLAREEFGAAPDVADDVESAGGTETGRRLADCVRDGVAFHHAGLRSSHRATVEAAFRDRLIDVICATPTLAAGVNVPARRVIVRDQQRYTGSSIEWLPALEVHQMCGRAGRPGLDPYGEAVLVGDDESEAELRRRYLDAGPEAVESKLADRAALRTHVLSLVAAGFADDRAGVLDVLGATFYADQRPSGDLSGVVDAVIGDLADAGMIEVDPVDPVAAGDAAGDRRLRATDLGAQVSRQYVTPETGARIVDGLRSAAGADEADVTGLTALEIVCDTPDMQDTYLGNSERAAIYRYASEHAAEFTTGMGDADDFEGWLEAVKTARILHEWCEGASVERIVEDYRIGPGDLESRIERAEWLLGAADALATIVDAPMAELGSVRARL